MGNLKSDLAEALREAENSVLGIVARAAEARDYEMIDRARSVAEELNSLGSKLAVTAGISRDLSEKKTYPSKPKPAKSSGGRYPKFHIKDGSLFKTGWSKKKRSEYTHRVPLDRVEAVNSALAEVSQKIPGVVTADQILQSETLQATEVPAYQVYVVLALLRQEKVIASVGREGYRLPSDVYAKADSIAKQLVNQ